MVGHVGAKVRFLAHIEAVKADLKAGWSVLQIHQRHNNQMNISYRQLIRLIDRHCPNLAP